MSKRNSRGSLSLCDPTYASSESESDSDSNSRVEDVKHDREPQDCQSPKQSELPKQTSPSFSMTVKPLAAAAAKQSNVSKIEKPSDTAGTFKLSLATQNKKIPENLRVASNVANVFNEEDDTDEVEQMPPEAKMRMRNLGKGTPTAAGPNSFCKGKLGFCNVQKIFQRELDKGSDEPQPKKKKL